MISAFGMNASTLVSNTNTSISTEEGDGFGLAFLDFVTELASRPVVPHVLSLSLGSLSAYSCDLLCSEAAKTGEVSLADCQAYLQEQRQVCMFVSQDQVARINHALMALGLRGVSVLGSSGDGGSHWSFGKFHGFGKIPRLLCVARALAVLTSESLARCVLLAARCSLLPALTCPLLFARSSLRTPLCCVLTQIWRIADRLRRNKIGCEFMFPIYPSPSPYMISVGGTDWVGGDPSQPETWAGFGGGSGGGFSWQFPSPDHQKAAVRTYLQTAVDLPPSSSYNASGRAYPDISAVAVDGTSQSSPVFAGIFTQIVDARLSKGLPPLGPLGPRIYRIATQFPGVAFEDVTKGNSKTSCQSGFAAAKGWDPTTGWGRPVWPGLLAHFGSDDSLH